MTVFSRFSFLLKLKLLWRLDKGNGRAHKTCRPNSLTWSKLLFKRCNAPFQGRGMKNFLASAVFQSVVRAELMGKGARGNFRSQAPRTYCLM